jgi:DNA helicase IV
VLLASVRSQTGVTIVGDLNQKILPDVDFIGWDALATKLGVSGAQVTRLEVVHRSTGAIMRVADSVLGEAASGASTGATPTLTLAASPDAKIDEVAVIAKAARELDRAAHVCVVCRNKTDAQRVHAALASTLPDLDAPVRLGHSKLFEFTPGITVTNAQQVKGLEFDVVIVFDPSPQRYPATMDARRALYMVITRAKERLHFVGHGDVSPLLQPALEHGLIEVRRKPSFPPVVFTEADEDPF